MNENMKMKVKKVLRILRWVAVVFVVLLVARLPFYLRNENTKEQVAKIHATKLTMDDVMGVNLPPDPGTEADKTVAGIDANKNGIRDDVELAIFKEYPNSAKTRAVLLQYALALQMEVMQPIVNIGTVTAVAEKTSSGHYCIGSITSRDDIEKFIKIGDILHEFVEGRQLNTEDRKKAQHDFYQENLGSYSTVLSESCDLDTSKL
ncbi:MAG TPA: hypothetical protein DCS23_01025 [Candidatus Yonathbacteria bacterium]|nr:hypothetical protein [Candidatus Yonathbacteria bacterium]